MLTPSHICGIAGIQALVLTLLLLTGSAGFTLRLSALRQAIQPVQSNMQCMSVIASPEFAPVQGLSVFFNTAILVPGKSSGGGRPVHDMVPRTSHYSVMTLQPAIGTLNSGEPNTSTLSLPRIIPDLLLHRPVNSRNTVRLSIRAITGIYLTALETGRNTLPTALPEIRKKGVDALVFDIKDVDGTISYNTQLPLPRSAGATRNYPVDDLQKLTAQMKRHGFYRIARIACFRDHLMANQNPGLAVRTRNGRDIWGKQSGELWLDPSNRLAQDYIIDLAREVAMNGVDEIQLDYIRFPTANSLHEARFAWHDGIRNREEVITAFLKRIQQALQPFHINLSIDVFGVVAWGNESDIRTTGQRISDLAKYCDVMSPMLYPSHFNDHFDGYARPGDNPEYFIAKGIGLIKAQTSTENIRPWLQAFGWRVSSYTPDYISKQISASEKSGAAGYLFWNAASDYRTVYQALERKKK